MRRLVTISTASVVDGPGFDISVEPGSFEIMEGATGMTPVGIQRTHVTQETAEAVAVKFPDLYRIVGEVDELERLMSLPDRRQRGATA